VRARCEACAVEAETPAEGPAAAFLLPFALHTGEHPTPHPLAVPGAAGGPHCLLLRCLAPACRSRPSEVVVQTTEAMAAVHALCFHSYHEGHTLHVAWDGVVIHDAWRDREGAPTGQPEWQPR